MNKKSRLFILVLLVISLSSLVACGRGTGPASEELPWIATPVYQGTTEMDVKLGLRTTDAVGEKNYIVILADFPDVERQFPEETISNRLLDFLSNYIYKSSYHKLTLTGVMTKRYMLPHPVGYYKISAANLDVDRDKVLSLVTDAVNAADADMAFAEDLDVIISLGATPKEYGMVGYSAIPGMLGFLSTTPITTKSGEKVSKAVVFCENAHLGTYVHDTVHMLGGVVEGRRMTPCLYDHDLQEKYANTGELGKIAVNMGFWDPLSSHWPYDKKLPPAGLSSWTRLRLGWIDPSKIVLVKPGETTTVKLDPLVSDEATTLVIKIPVSDFSYYLIENRQPIESDANLPSSGVLVLYGDDTVLECRHGSAPIKIKDANPNVPYLNDAAFDIGKNDTYVDTENNIAIVLLQKEGQSYIVQVTTPDQVNK
jgi:M6 family metalloprotease-like protein